jgi:hypothetical protein
MLSFDFQQQQFEIAGPTLPIHIGSAGVRARPTAQSGPELLRTKPNEPNQAEQGSKPSTHTR